jgi:hypothetical protein
MKQTINIGGHADDGTGDHLRDAMDKINDNFNEIYSYPIIVPETVNRILTLTDNFSYILMDSASACTVTVPPEVDVNFPDGSTISIFQTGDGQVTISPGAGVQINSADTVTKTRVKYSGVSIHKIGTNLWMLTGDAE